MRKALAPIFLLLICAAVAFAVQESTWINYTSAEGRYSVALPSQPEVASQESTTPGGTKLTQYKATVVKESTVFMVGYFDYVPGTTFSLDKARDGMVSGVKGTLLSESVISLAGSPGRELKVVTNTEGTEFVMRARVFDLDRRVYVLQFIVPKSDEDSTSATNAAKYFDSFKVLK